MILILSFQTHQFPINGEPHISGGFTKNPFINYVGKVVDFGRYLTGSIIRDLVHKFGDGALYWAADQFMTMNLHQPDQFRGDFDYAMYCIMSSSRKFECSQDPDFNKKQINEFRNTTYKYNICEVTPEVFYYHHSLRFMNQKLLDYIKSRTIFDVGTYCGDSAIILVNYTNKPVYSYEMDRKLYEQAQKSFKANGIDSKMVLFNKGIGTSVYSSFTTIDEEVKKHGLTAGFLKADIEGHGYKMILGAKETIRMQRPIIHIASYHNFDEFFGIPLFLMQFPNYIFEYRSLSYQRDTMGEHAILAYPAEIIYPEFPHNIYD